jgi:type III secretion protein O
VTILDDILAVKQIREQAASREVSRAQARAEDAARIVEKARKTLKDYNTWRLKREIELYDSILNQLVHVQDLEDLKERIAQLREKELSLENDIVEAENARVAAAAALTEAKAAHLRTLREVDKMRELVEEEHAALAREAERRAEVELEDFRSRGPMKRMEEMADG